jgi:hypothetical protein
MSPVKAGDKVVNELRHRGVLADEDETWGHLDALPLPQLEFLLIVAVERLQRCLKSRWKLKRIEFLAFAAPFRWHVLANVLPEPLRKKAVADKSYNPAYVELSAHGFET